MSLNKFQGIVIALMVIGILVGATMLALTSFRDALTASSTEYNATNNWVTAGSNLSSNAGTAGTLFGVGLIVLAAFAIFAFMGRGNSV